MITRAKIEEIKRAQKENAKSPLKRPAFGPPEVFGTPPKMEQHIHHHQNIKQADVDV